MLFAYSGALGQPRLLVPVVLVMVFNRWNGYAYLTSSGLLCLCAVKHGFVFYISEQLLVENNSVVSSVLLQRTLLTEVSQWWGGCRLAVPQYDVMPLQLIPMLVGFFTYKAATLAETFRELLPSSQSEESDS